MSHQDSGEPDTPAPRRLFKVADMSKRHSFLTEASLRWDIFCSKERHGAQSLIPANGLADAIVRKGRSVLIDEDKYFEILAKKSVEANRD